MNSVVLLFAAVSGGLASEGEAARRAELRSQILRAARAEVSAAEANVEAASLGLVPEISVRLGYSRLGGFEDGGFPGPGGTFQPVKIPRNRATAEVQLRYGVLGALLGRLQQIESMQARAVAERLEAEADRLDVRLEAKVRFHAYLAAVETASVAEASLHLAEVQKGRVEARLEAGEATRADVASAEARLQARVAERVQAGAARATARTRLQTWIGLRREEIVRPPDAWLQLRPSFVVQASRAALLAQALRSRPEIRAFDALEEAEGSRRGSLLAEIIPEFDLRASYLHANPNPNIIPPREEWEGSYTLGGQITWSLERALAGMAQRREAGAAADRVRALRADLRRSIEEELFMTLDDLDAARAVLGSAHARVSAAQESFHARSAAFELGRATLDELLDADLELARARLQVVESAVAHHGARARLERVIGSLPRS
ncbi:MAG: TolC family protein [Myxococcota bacterium]